MNRKQKKELRQRQSTRQLMGIVRVTPHGIVTDSGERVFFLIQPDNLSVLSPEVIRGRVRSLTMLLSTQPSLEILALDSRESFQRNKEYYADAQKSSAMLTESISPENSAPTTRAKVEFTASAVPAQPQAQNTPAPSTEDTGSSDAATSKDAAPPVGEMTPTHSQPSGQAGQTAPAGAEYRAPTVGETVVRMLHHMSRIFEDNSKLDQIHRGLQIDRKRRQELQRKRLAMGHKPDDHEEQMFR